MQAPVTVATPPAEARPNHVRLGRSGPAALQAAAPRGDFSDAIDHALAGPGGDAPAQSGGTGVDKGPKSAKPLAPAAPPPTPACIPPAHAMQVAGPAAGADKEDGGVPLLRAAETGEDVQPAPALRTADAELTIASPQLAPPALLPVSTTAARAPALDDPNITSSALEAPTATGLAIEPLSIPITTTDATAAKQEVGQPGPSTPLPALHGIAQPETIGAVVRNGPGRPSATATVDETVASTVSTAEDAAALPTPALTLHVASTPPLATAPLHLAAASPRPSADVVQSPAEQVGPTLASFVTGAAQPGAPQHLTIRLDPLDLGRVQVRIEHVPGGAARVDLVVERPDTLLLLLRDQPQLHRALDLAGVPAADRTLQFHLAPPSSSAAGTMGSQPNADPGFGQHRHTQSGQQRGSDAGRAAFLDGPTARSSVALRRAGIDITA